MDGPLLQMINFWIVIIMSLSNAWTSLVNTILVAIIGS
jgi:hypothetical protein